MPMAPMRPGRSANSTRCSSGSLTRIDLAQSRRRERGREPCSNDDLIAHVVDGSPAHEAGIRNGDVLLKIADLDVTRWRTDPTVLPLSRFWQEPAGTKLRLTIRRGNETPEISVLLRNILPPSAD